jgi:hypothetical protein
MWQYGYQWWEPDDTPGDPLYVPVDVPLGEFSTFRDALTELAEFVQKEAIDTECLQFADYETLLAEIQAFLGRTDLLDKPDNEQKDVDFVDNLGIEYYVVQL